jgi:hypothetical protein
MLYLAIAIYAAAMIGANLSVATWGPAVSPINAFFLIGLDLALRDWLHVRLRPIQMGALIAATPFTIRAARLDAAAFTPPAKFVIPPTVVDPAVVTSTGRPLASAPATAAVIITCAPAAVAV